MTCVTVMLVVQVSGCISTFIQVLSTVFHQVAVVCSCSNLDRFRIVCLSGTPRTSAVIVMSPVLRLIEIVLGGPWEFGAHAPLL